MVAELTLGLSECRRRESTAGSSAWAADLKSQGGAEWPPAGRGAGTGATQGPVQTHGGVHIALNAPDCFRSGRMTNWTSMRERGQADSEIGTGSGPSKVVTWQGLGFERAFSNNGNPAPGPTITDSPRPRSASKASWAVSAMAGRTGPAGGEARGEEGCAWAAADLSQTRTASERAGLSRPKAGAHVTTPPYKMGTCLRNQRCDEPCSAFSLIHTAPVYLFGATACTA